MTPPDVQGWIAQTACGLRGHVFLDVFEPARWALRCSLCGYESPGWALDGPRPIAAPPPVVPFSRVEAKP